MGIYILGIWQMNLRWDLGVSEKGVYRVPAKWRFMINSWSTIKSRLNQEFKAEIWFQVDSFVLAGCEFRKGWLSPQVLIYGRHSPNLRPRYWFFQLLWLALWQSPKHTHTHKNAGTDGHGGPSYLDSFERFQIGFFGATLKSCGVGTSAHCRKLYDLFEGADWDQRYGSKLSPAQIKLMVLSP